MSEDRTPAKRQSRNRAATEAAILSAAIRLLERDGALAGLSLTEVADEAKVNRGLIYQYYGSRQQLLRAAILQLGWGEHPVFYEGQKIPFHERRVQIFEEAIKHTDAIRLFALLVLDNSEGTAVFPQLEYSLKSVARDKAAGLIGDDVDGAAAHLLSVALYFGYSALREPFAREAGLSLDDLDARALRTFDQMLRGLDPKTLSE